MSQNHGGLLSGLHVRMICWRWEGKVPKETVLFPLSKAQGVLLQALKSGNCDNTKILPFRGGLTMFTTPRELPDPFATNILEAVQRDPGYSLLKVLVKSMINPLKNDLSDFMQARRAYRKHVFSSAEISHEPTRLINGPIWVNLFSTSWYEKQ